VRGWMRLWRPLRLPRWRRRLRIPRLRKHGGHTEGRQQQKRPETARNSFPAQHLRSPIRPANYG
jgi:hypothetical protein